MTAPAANPYLPGTAVLDRVTDEIRDVRTFHWHFEDPAAQEAFRFRPGQFAQVSILGDGEFPASLPPGPEEGASFFTIRRVGRCTAALHALQPGARFGVRGPYGNGFPMSDYAGRNLVFIAGGIGIIPLRSCIIHALAHRSDYRRILVLYGARTPHDLMYRDSLAAWKSCGSLECHLTVDRAEAGWKDHVGTVGRLLALPDTNPPVADTTAFVCGPPVMFRFVIRDLLALGFAPRDIVSTLERYMKCGLGKCGHCCIGLAYVCTDGPVFTCEQIRELGEDI